jgi:hypothetical protein
LYHFILTRRAKEIFKVTFNDGSSTECCDEHLWLTQTYSERNSANNAKRLGKSWNCATPKVRSLSEIRKTLVSSHINAKNHSIPIVGTVDFDERDVPLDPYVVGAILGDGCLTHNEVLLHADDPEIINRVARRIPYEVIATDRGERGGCFAFIKTRGKVNTLMQKLEWLGLMGHGAASKFVPNVYKFNSSTVRLEVLRGLMDTDGSVSKHGTSCYFYSISDQLADDVAFIVQSLGGTVLRNIKHPFYTHNGERRQGAPCHIITIRLPASINPFHLKRKADAVVGKTKYSPVRYIVSVESVGIKEAQCITVAHPSHLYVTDDFIVTHNSWVQACGAMEMRRLGLAKKPLLTVPNHLLGQTCDTMRDLYPNAHILQATPDDLKKENRRKFLAKIATGDWDAIVMTHSMFGRIGLSADTERNFFAKQIKELDECLTEVHQEEGGKSKTAKELVKQRKRLEEKLETRMQRHAKMDDFMPFEQLGVDQLLVDEAHMYKNLFMATKMQRVKGLPNTESQRAFDMFMKVNHIQHVNNGGGVRFLTGTPITNTMAEMFTMQRYLQPQWLEEHNMSHFDAWAQNFGDYSNSVEYTVAGKMKATTRFNHFTNVPELAAAYNQFADTKTAEQLKLSLPKVNRFEVACEPSPEQTAYVESLGRRADSLATGQIDPRLDNMLKITSDGRKCSLDARLVNPDAPDFEGGKINRCIENLVRIHKDTAPRKSTQCVFLDLSTPKSAPEGDRPEAEVEGDTESDTDTGEEKGIRDSVYQEIKRKLVARGVPDNEIAFIHDAKTDAQKSALFTKMNKGEVRILLGSTEKMGTGMNAQNKMYALHHLDCPWRPDMLEQREGRIVRQGNENMDGVDIYNYATKGEGAAMSMDAFMWQTVENKARAIAQVKNGDPSIRTIEDIGDMVLTSSQMKALASGNPLLKEHVDVSNQYKRLLGLQKEHNRTIFENQSKLQSIPAAIKRRNVDIEAKRANSQLFEQNKPQKFQASLGGRSFDSSTEAGDMIMLAAKDAKVESEDHLGSYAGFEIMLTRDKLTGNPSLLLQNPHRKGTAASIDIAYDDKPAGLFTRINNKLSQFSKDADEQEQKNVADERRMKEIEGLSTKFQHADKLHTLERRLQELDAELQLDKDAPVSMEEPNSPAEQRADNRDARAASVNAQPTQNYDAAAEFKRRGDEMSAEHERMAATSHEAEIARGQRGYAQNYQNADGMKWPKFQNGWEYPLTLPEGNVVNARVKNIPGITDEIRVYYKDQYGNMASEVMPKDRLSGVSITKSMVFIKAVLLSKPDADGNRTMTGVASDVKTPHTFSYSTIHHDNMVAPLHATEGLGEVKTKYQAPSTSGFPKHTYGHSITHGNPEAAVNSIRAKMASSGHTVSPVVSEKDPVTGLSHHTFSAHFGNVQHVFRVKEAAPGPSAMVHIKAGAQALGSRVSRGIVNAGKAAAKLGSSAVKIAVHAKPKKDTPIENPLHTAPIYQASSVIKGLKHAKTEVSSAGQNHIKEPTDRNYTHWFAHRNPQVSAKRMSAVLAGQGHRVSGISQKKTYMPDGSIRHQYSFSSTPGDGGPSHTVNLYRA